MGQIIGACRYCGQVGTSIGEFETQAAADNWATENCSCPRAESDRKLQEQIEDAQDRVLQLFGAACEEYGFRPVPERETIELLDNIVERVARGCVLSASVTVNGYGKASISMTSKGKIRVQRSETRAYQLEE